MILFIVIIVIVNLRRRHVKSLMVIIVTPRLGVDLKRQQSSIVIVHLRANQLLSLFGAGEAGMELVGWRLFLNVGHLVLSCIATYTGVHYIDKIFPINNS